MIYNNWAFFLCIIISYLLGSIPFGLCISHLLSGIDIRKHGSNNIGASNITRIIGKKAGFLVLLLDLLKGFIVPFCCKYYLKLTPEECFFIGSFAILGHIFPIWLKFSGGKGVATSLGTILVFNPVFSLIFISLWIILFKVFKQPFISSIISQLTICVIILFTSNNSNYLKLNIGIITVIIIMKHKKNVLKYYRAYKEKN